MLLCSLMPVLCSVVLLQTRYGWRKLYRYFAVCAAIYAMESTNFPNRCFGVSLGPFAIFWGNGPCLLQDVATRVIAEGLKPEETSVSKVMTRNPIFVMGDTLAVDALQKMVQGDYCYLLWFKNRISCVFSCSLSPPRMSIFFSAVNWKWISRISLDWPHRGGLLF